MAKTAQTGAAKKFLKLASSVSGFIKDGWENVFTGLGVGGKDKRTGSTMKYRPLSEKEVEDLHDGDDIAHRVVNLIPTEGTRDWIEIKVNDDENLSKAITDAEENLELQSKIEKAWAYSRLYRGAAIFMAVDDGLELSEPINPNRLVRINS